jgi:nucleoid DNA-binding protein
MTKTELVESLANIHDNLSGAEIGRIMETLISLISATVKRGEQVKIAGLGIFILKDVKERAGINPKTLEKITIPAHKAVKFKVSETLKKYVQS